MRVSALSMGLLQTLAYKNPDFTQVMYSDYINWIAIGMNNTFDPVFSSKQMYYSMTIQGVMTCQVSDTYQLFIVSNKKVELYIDGKLAMNKTQDVETSRIIRNLFINTFYTVELRIIVDDKIPEHGAKPYIRMRWETQNMVNMDIKPRNFFTVNPISSNGDNFITIQAAAASSINSIVVDTTSGITDTEYDSARRLTYKIIPVTESITGMLNLL